MSKTDTHSAPQHVITAATSDLALQEAARLMWAYKERLGLEVFDNPGQRSDEVLPGPYAARDAGILLAWRDVGQAPPALGVVAFKGIRLDDGRQVSEMKRLFVAPEGQGNGLGRALSVAVMEAARAAGHRYMVLDTLPRLTAACRLYEDLGFVRIPRYNDNPVESVVFYGIAL